MSEADEHRQNVATWRALEAEGAALIMQASGLSFAFVLAMIFLPSSTASMMFAATCLWALIISQAIMVALHENCRKWQDWHHSMIEDPEQWPWPAFPSGD